MKSLRMHYPSDSSWHYSVAHREGGIIMGEDTAVQRLRDLPTETEEVWNWTTEPRASDSESWTPWWSVTFEIIQ